MWIWSDSGTSETDTVTLELNHESDPLAARTDIRVDLVQRVRREIAEGTYDSPDKWETALDNLLDRLEQAD
jgi:hypothetical protein